MTKKTVKADTVSKDLTTVMTKKSNVKSPAKDSKYLNKVQIESAVSTLKARILDITNAEHSVVLCAIELGKELSALQHGLPRGDFYPIAEKQVKLKRASIKLYITCYKNTKLVEKASSLNEARNLITKKNTGKPSAQESNSTEEKNTKKEPGIRNATGSKPIKELSPLECADVIIEAIQNTLAKLPESNRAETIATLKDLITDLAV